MINGELIVDNFAGGGGTLQSSRAVCSGKDAKSYKGQDRNRCRWTVSICVTVRRMDIDRSRIKRSNTGNQEQHHADSDTAEAY